jgi:hypothetical protein
MLLATHRQQQATLKGTGLHELESLSIWKKKIWSFKQAEEDTMVWTIPIRWDLNVVTVLAMSKADMSPTRILWTVLWIVQYVPVLPIPALSNREVVSDVKEI